MLYQAGFESASYFVDRAGPTPGAAADPLVGGSPRTPPRNPAELTRLRKRANEAWNPSAGLADRALDDRRLPYVKIDTLRYDPYGLDAGRPTPTRRGRFAREFGGGPRGRIEAERPSTRRGPPRSCSPPPGPAPSALRRPLLGARSATSWTSERPRPSTPSSGRAPGACEPRDPVPPRGRSWRAVCSTRSSSRPSSQTTYASADQGRRGVPHLRLEPPSPPDRAKTSSIPSATSCPNTRARAAVYLADPRVGAHCHRAPARRPRPAPR